MFGAMIFFQMFFSLMPLRLTSKHCGTEVLLPFTGFVAECAKSIMVWASLNWRNTVQKQTANRAREQIDVLG